MNHPPIPPNCQYIKIAPSGELLFFTGTCWKRVDIEDNCIRVITASVARCAWMDEGVLAKIEDENIMQGRSSYRSGAERKACCAANERYRDALRNETAWAKWGKGEDWQ